MSGGANGTPAQHHSCRGAWRLPGKAAHTRCVNAMRPGVQAACATCLVWGEPSRSCLVQLDCQDRHTRAPGPAKHFRATLGQGVPTAGGGSRWFTSISFPMTGSPCHCTPVRLPHTEQTPGQLLPSMDHTWRGRIPLQDAGSHTQTCHSTARGPLPRVTSTWLPISLFQSPGPHTIQILIKPYIMLSFVWGLLLRRAVGEVSPQIK